MTEIVANSSNSVVKYYFMSEQSQNSLTVEQFLRRARFALPEAFINGTEFPNSDRYTYLINPVNSEICKIWHNIRSNNVTIAILQDLIKEEVIKHIETKFVIDQSRTANDKICSLSQEEWSNPYYLNLTGRSYNRDAIVEAIKSTILQDEILRLEDITLTPEIVDKIVLTPNPNLDNMVSKMFNQPIIKYTFEMVKRGNYDLSKIYRNNIRDFSTELIPILAEADQNLIWKFKEVWAAYAKHRGLDPWSGNSVSVRDLSLTGINLIKHHPKCDSGHFVFKNCLFTDCVLLKDQCWCGISFENCRFFKCTIVSIKNYVSHRPLKDKYCTYHDCSQISVEKTTDIPWI